MNDLRPNAEAIEAVDEIFALIFAELHQCRRTVDKPDVTAAEVAQVNHTAKELGQAAFGLHIDLLTRIGELRLQMAASKSE
jgi:hypothetical protein